MSIQRADAARRRPRRRWRSRSGLMVPTAEAVAEAIETIPHGMPWAWAALRVMPAVRGERIAHLDDVDLDEIGFAGIGEYPSLELPPGVDVTFAIDVDVVAVTVAQAQLDAWDMTLEQVLPVAMGNLRRAVGTWRGEVREDRYEGFPIRMLQDGPPWASSLVLDVDLLTRCFGSDDQLFVAPYTCNLVSLPADADLDVAADLVDLFGTINPSSLLIGLPAFVLRDGQLTTQDLPGFEVPEDAMIDLDDELDDDPGWPVPPEVAPATTRATPPPEPATRD